MVLEAPPPKKRIGGAVGLFSVSFPIVYPRVALIAQAHQVIEVEGQRPPLVRVIDIHERLDVMHVVSQSCYPFPLA